MYHFNFQNPTKLIFGKGQITQLANLIPTYKNIMITYGGGSIFKNGIYNQVTMEYLTLPTQKVGK